jgi:hypothetical protein
MLSHYVSMSTLIAAEFQLFAYTRLLLPNLGFRYE